MSTDPNNGLRALLRGEIAATEAYGRALVRTPPEHHELLRLLGSAHGAAVDSLRRQLAIHSQRAKAGGGGAPEWGCFGRRAASGPLLVDARAALTTLQRGEQRRLRSYALALQDDGLAPPTRSWVQDEGLPRQQDHVRRFDALLRGD